MASVSRELKMSASVLLCITEHNLNFKIRRLEVNFQNEYGLLFNYFSRLSKQTNLKITPSVPINCNLV